MQRRVVRLFRDFLSECDDRLEPLDIGVYAFLEIVHARMVLVRKRFQMVVRCLDFGERDGEFQPVVVDRAVVERGGGVCIVGQYVLRQRGVHYKKTRGGVFDVRKIRDEFVAGFGPGFGVGLSGRYVACDEFANSSAHRVEFAVGWRRRLRTRHQRRRKSGNRNSFHMTPRFSSVAAIISQCADFVCGEFQSV